MTDSERNAVRWMNLTATALQKAWVYKRMIELARSYVSPAHTTREATQILCRLQAQAVFEVVASELTVPLSANQ